MNKLSIKTNKQKFKEALLYVLCRVGNKPNIGKTVIQKLLYFIDFDYYEMYEEFLIGVSYTKNKFGPTSNEFDEIIKDMEDDKDVLVLNKKEKYKPKTVYKPLRESDLSVFSAKEIKLIDNVIERLSDKNANSISEYSHCDVPWIGTKDNELIDYRAVFYRTPAYSVRNYSEEDCS